MILETMSMHGPRERQKRRHEGCGDEELSLRASRSEFESIEEKEAAVVHPYDH
jgi:hypothetical protein